MHRLLIAALLSQMIASRRLAPERVVYAINCGSTVPLKSADGFVYQPVR